jgi:predicted GNAT family acetyltransferase
MPDGTPKVVDNEQAGRFEVTLDGQLAELVYQREGGLLELLHTEVPAALEGRGVGGALVRAAVDEAAERGWTVVPLCPFARAWLRRHPDVAAQVRIEWPADES